MLPLLMVDNDRKHLDESMPMFKGHLKRVRQCIRSTSKRKVKDPRDEETDQFELTAEPKYNKVYVRMIDTRGLKNTAFTDFTGAFPYTSSQGHR